MQAAVTYAANQPIEVVDIELGELGPYDIQVEIKFSGLCHSDDSRDITRRAVASIEACHQCLFSVHFIGRKTEL